MARIAAVAFDLFETLVTEFDPHWRPAPTNAARLGVPPSCFADVWRTRKQDRMTSTVDYRDVLRQVCAASDVAIDPHTSEISKGSTQNDWRPRRSPSQTSITASSTHSIDSAPQDSSSA